MNLREKLYVRYPLEVLGFALVVAVVVFIGRNAMTRAEVADFHPSTCLGTWQNVSLAEGVPETFEVEGMAPDASNSAESTPGGYLVCGGFLPPDHEPLGEIQSVVLTLVWKVAPLPQPEAPPSPPPSEPPASESPSQPAETPPPPPSEPPPPEAPPPADGQAPEPEPLSPEPSPTEPPPPVGGEGPPPEAPPQASPHVRPLAFLVARALAQETSSSEPVTPLLSEQPLSEVPSPAPPPAVAEETEIVEPVATVAETSSSPTSTPPAALPAEEPEVQYSPPAPPDDHFFKVTYTLNGAAWFELIRVNEENWPHLTLLLPVTEWDELRDLQVNIEEVPTTAAGVPRAYLDGMLIEVQYERPVPASEAIQEIGEPAAEGAIPEELEQPGEVEPPVGIIDTIREALLRETQPEGTVLPPASPPPFTGESVVASPTSVIQDPSARHACAVTPFSASVERGSTVRFEVSLSPSYGGARYSIALGNLPRGIAAAIGDASGNATYFARPTVTFRADPDASVASYNIIVLYRETEESGGELTASCKLNLIVSE